jgi:hypothetical protein
MAAAADVFAGSSSRSCSRSREFPRSSQLAENKKAPKQALGAKGDGGGPNSRNKVEGAIEIRP